MSLRKVIFIHGNESMGWRFPWCMWLKTELDKLGITTLFETFPDSILARKQYWLPFLKDYLQADENTLLIGWSSGAVAAMRYAETHTIWGSILIAPCYTDLGLESEKISGWYDEPWAWNKIKTHQRSIVFMSSKNDEIIPQAEFAHIKEKLQPDQILEFADRGHFIHQSTFPELVTVVQNLLASDK